MSVGVQPVGMRAAATVLGAALLVVAIGLGIARTGDDERGASDDEDPAALGDGYRSRPAPAVLLERPTPRRATPSVTTYLQPAARVLTAPCDCYYTFTPAYRLSAAAPTQQHGARSPPRA